MNTRLRDAVAAAHGVIRADRSSPRPRIHVGSAVVDYMKTMCLTEDSRRPPATRFAGFDVVEEPDWDADRIVVRVDREIL